MTTGTDFNDNISLLTEYKNGNTKAKEALIKNNYRLVTGIAQKFCGRGTELEDLIEIGLLGLLKAIDGFDENLGFSFSTYAFPLITGEIKRHLRDDGQIKISRLIKRNALTIHKAKEDFTKTNGREPKLSELSTITGLSEEDICQAAASTLPIISLQEKTGSGEKDSSFEEMIADEDIFDDITDLLTLRQAIDGLCDDEKKLLHLRFFKNLTQSNTAKILGTSQVTISRAEKKIIDKLRQKIL